MDEHGYLSGEQIRTLQNAGWEIASHTWDHSFLTQIQKSQLPFQIEESKKYLEKWFGKTISVFVYPG
jgi:peptidoglycan/xylan/chitin deacetylase (PgdA/CDA1 family)